MEWSIRPATAADIDCCARIESTCFPPEQAADRERMAGRGAAWPQHILLGTVDGEAVGFVMGPVIAHPVITDELFADPGCHCESAPYQSVFSLAVHPDHRRKGFGAAIVRTLLRHAKDARLESVSLEVRASNTAAIELYKRAGFAEAGRRKGFYTKPTEDALVMVCKIK